jgi:CHAD domain-containing protein
MLMSYRLNPQTPISREIRRIAREQINPTIELLQARSGKEQGQRVHDARKHLKKLRALLRLIQCNLSDDVLKQENRTFRDAGRKLSATRDAQVRLKTLEKLQKESGANSGTLQQALEEITSTLAIPAKNLPASSDPAGTEAIAILGSAGKRVKKWPMKRLRPTDLCRGLQSVYRRGRKTFAQTRNESSSENLHEWRKRVKDLWYQLRLLQETWPELLKPYAQQTKLLSEYLGDAHDLDVLRDTIQGLTEVSSKGRQKVIQLIEKKRAALQEKAFSLGHRVYAEKPGALARRIEVCWNTADQGKEGAGR